MSNMVAISLVAFSALCLEHPNWPEDTGGLNIQTKTGNSNNTWKEATLPSELFQRGGGRDAIMKQARCIGVMEEVIREKNLGLDIRFFYKDRYGNFIHQPKVVVNRDAGTASAAEATKTPAVRSAEVCNELLERMGEDEYIALIGKYSGMDDSTRLPLLARKLEALKANSEQAEGGQDNEGSENEVPL